MIYKGFVKNGVVVLEDNGHLAEGEKVQVISVDRPTHDAGDPPAKSFYEAMRPFIGSVKGLPADFARNHDHYIHGTPKGIDDA